MKGIIIFLLLCAAIWPALGSAQRAAKNVLVGDCQIAVVYPEMLELVFNKVTNMLTITKIDAKTGNYDQQQYLAVLTGDEKKGYRIEFCAGSYAEISTEGNTTLYHNGTTEAFFSGLMPLQ